MVVDVVVAAAAFALSAAELAGAEPVASDLREPDAAAYVLVAFVQRVADPASGDTAGRRRSAGSPSGCAYASAQYPPALTPIVLLSIYTAAAVLPQQRARLLLAIGVGSGILGATVSPGAHRCRACLRSSSSAWLLGNYVGSRRNYTAELEAKNRQLEQARVELAERAVTDERLRIARELHDVVAHTMSVVAVQAGTGRMVADDDPAAARQALATIETTARSALGEMRRMLGILRGSERPSRARSRQPRGWETSTRWSPMSSASGVDRRGPGGGRSDRRAVLVSTLPPIASCKRRSPT